MNNKIISYTAEPAATRWIYLKTAIVIVAATLVLNFFAQMKLVQQLELKYSSIACLLLSSLIIYGLTRSPVTKSLTIDYDQSRVVVDYLTLTKANNSLEIPFERLGVKTDDNAASSIAKWKTWLMLDGKNVYLLLNSETGFTEAQMNEFNERVKVVANQGTINLDEKQHA